MLQILKMIARKFRLKTSLWIKLCIVGLIIFSLLHLELFPGKQVISQVAYHNKADVIRVNPKVLRSCKLNLRYLSSHVIEIHDVILHPKLAIGHRKGGEAIAKVKGQKEEDEYFKFEHGFLNVSCLGNNIIQEEFQPVKTKYLIQKSYTSDIIGSVSSSVLITNSTHYEDNIEGLTVGVARTDYANMYWTVIELYSAYFSARVMNRSCQDTTILIMDAHPEGHLDDLWSVGFKKVIQLGWMNKTTHLEDFALVPNLRLVSIVKGAASIPFMDDFRSDLSLRSGASATRKINCRRIQITLVLRRDYIAHPRNVQGTVKRQLENPDVLFKALQAAFPNDTVRPVAYETLPVQEQVKLSAESDILIGVHGAGLAHTVFQVPGSGLIELFPNEYRRKTNPHFEQLAKWSGKTYASWFSDKTSYLLYVPPRVLTDMVSQMRQKICKVKI